MSNRSRIAATSVGLNRCIRLLPKGNDMLGVMWPRLIQGSIVPVFTKKSRASCSTYYSLDYSTIFGGRVAVVALSLQPFQQTAVPHAVACLAAKYRVEHPCDKPLRFV